MEYKTLDKDFMPYYFDEDFTISNSKLYTESFNDIINERIATLCEVVFENGNPIYSVKSLQALQYFINNNVNIRELSDDEIQNAMFKLPKELRTEDNIDKQDFVEPTFSIAFDVGLFFGECIRSENPDLLWELENDPENALYGHMVFQKNGVELSPFQLTYVLVRQIRDGRAREDRLVQLFNTWLKIFHEN